jgi:hypothetical protein
MSVSKMIAGAFEQAAQTHASLHEAWIRVSVRLGGVLPDSRLMSSVQNDGRLDLVLRCMEAECLAGAQEGLFESHYQRVLSEVWVGSVYETLRLIVERNREAATDEVHALAEDFRLLRVPLEKYEIASDRQLAAPLQLQRQPQKNDQSDLYEYSQDDPKRAHIMPTDLSSRGSVRWHVIDLKGGQDRWIERRSLSDRIIALFGRDTAADS